MFSRELRGRRYTSLVVRAPLLFFNQPLWPEFVDLKEALDEYLNQATDRIIREEVFRVSSEAEERRASPSTRR